VEANLARTLTMSQAMDINTFLMFFTRPICIVLIVFTVLSLLTPFLASRRTAKRASLLQKNGTTGDELE
jgi:TctA family transporter